MKQCPGCNTICEDDDRLCLRCGHAFESNTAQMYVPEDSEPDEHFMHFVQERVERLEKPSETGNQPQPPAKLSEIELGRVAGWIALLLFVASIGGFLWLLVRATEM